MNPRSASLVIALVVLAPATVAGQSRDDIRAAKQLFADGNTLFKDGKYDEAARAFEEAYELSKRTELLYNIGESYRRAGALRKAEKFLQQYLAEVPDAANADDVVDAIVEIQQQVAAELATVQVQTPTAGRSVLVDDDSEPHCTTPCAVTVAPGPHRLTLRAEGFADVVENVTLEPGKTVQLQMQMQPAVVMGRLIVSTDRPGSEVEVAGRTAPLPLQEPWELEAGAHEVRVRADRNTQWRGTVEVAPDDTTTLFVPMDSLVGARRRGSFRRGVAYGLFGVSAAAAVGGVLMGLQARESYSQLAERFAGDQPGNAALVDQGRSQQIAANILFGTAGAAAAAAIGLIVWELLE